MSQNTESYLISELSDHHPKDNWTVGSDTQIHELKMNDTEINTKLQDSLANLAQTLAYQPVRQEHELIPVQSVKIDSTELDQLIHKSETEKQQLLARMPLVPDRQSVARVAQQSHEVKMDTRALQQTVKNQLSERGYDVTPVAVPKPVVEIPIANDEFTSDDVRRYVIKISNGIPSIVKRLSEHDYVGLLQRMYPNDYVRYMQYVHEQQQSRIAAVPVTPTVVPVPKRPVYQLGRAM